MQIWYCGCAGTLMGVGAPIERLLRFSSVSSPIAAMTFTVHYLVDLVFEQGLNLRAGALCSHHDFPTATW